MPSDSKNEQLQRENAESLRPLSEMFPFSGDFRRRVFSIRTDWRRRQVADQTIVREASSKKGEEQECLVQGSSRCTGRQRVKRDISAVNHGELNRLLAPDFCYALQLWDGPFPRKLRVR